MDHQNVTPVASSPEVRERKALLREIRAALSEGLKSQGAWTGDGELRPEGMKCLEWRR